MLKLNDYMSILGISFIFKCIKTVQFNFNYKLDFLVNIYLICCKLLIFYFVIIIYLY